MLATERFLFVIRDGVLWQFDVATLAPLHSFAFPDGKDLPAIARREATRRELPAPPREVAPEPAPAAAAVPAEPVAGSIEAALRWLAAHQDESGKWDCDEFMKHDDPAAGKPCDGPGKAVHDVGVTGLALLAFLGAGSTMRGGPHKEQIKKAAKWLKEQQQENGLFGTNASHDFVYDHAIATYAMCEAYGLSDYQLLRANAQKGIDYLESHRNPYSVWRYQPRDNDNDTSVTTWALCAYRSADHFGLQVNKDAMKLVGVWYDQVSSPDGRAGYSKQGEPSSRMEGDHFARFPPQRGEAMTAAAAFGRYALGQDAKSKPILARAAERLVAKPPKWEAGHVDAVYWFFGTYALFQAGGEPWVTWQQALRTLVEHQRQDGNHAGSWDPVGVWDQEGGRVFTTALYALSLEAVARYQKLVK
ncbi:MAG: hypothetical protein WBO45_16295 [Planctomycetota bacterium]